MRTNRGTAIVRAGVLATLVACGGDDRAAAAAVPVDAARRDPPAGTGTITGVVRFVGNAPDNPTIDMGDAPRCRGAYHAPPRQLTVVVNRNRTLANVFVYVKRGLPPDAVYPPPHIPVTVRQRGCQYHPRVFGIGVGQPLEVRNDDFVRHDIATRTAGTRPVDISQPAAGRISEHTFRTPRVMVPLRCDVHPWMRAYAAVMPHPFYATTGDDGRFTIDHLPRGTYTIEAWHEKYGRRTATVTITDTTTARVSFTYEGSTGGAVTS